MPGMVSPFHCVQGDSSLQISSALPAAASTRWRWPAVTMSRSITWRTRRATNEYPRGSATASGATPAHPARSHVFPGPAGPCARAAPPGTRSPRTAAAASTRCAGRAQASEADPDGGDDRVRQAAGQGLVQGSERLGPRLRDRLQVESEGDGAKQLDGEQRHSRGIGRDPAGDPVDRDRRRTQAASARRAAGAPCDPAGEAGAPRRPGPARFGSGARPARGAGGGGRQRAGWRAECRPGPAGRRTESRRRTPDPATARHRPRARPAALRPRREAISTTARPSGWAEPSGDAGEALAASREAPRQRPRAPRAPRRRCRRRPAGRLARSRARRSTAAAIGLDGARGGDGEAVEPEPGQRLLQQTGLADAGLTLQHQHAARRSRLRAGDLLQQPAQLVGAPFERGPDDRVPLGLSARVWCRCAALAADALHQGPGLFARLGSHLLGQRAAEPVEDLQRARPVAGERQAPKRGRRARAPRSGSRASARVA